MGNMILSAASNLAANLGLGNADPAELINTLKATAFKGDVTDAQMMALLIVANQYGLNPWTKEIYAFPDKKNGIVPVVGVDGWSRIINSNQLMDGIEFNYSELLTTPQGAKASCPEWIECSIYKKGSARPVVVREYLDECYRAPFDSGKGYKIDGPWQSHPKRFLRHKALIQCARIAFGFAGIYDQDEAERIVEKDIGSGSAVEPKNQIDLDVVSSEIDTMNTEHDLSVYLRKKAVEIGYKKGDSCPVMDSIVALCTERKELIKAASLTQTDATQQEQIQP